jgi:hypothetical protein
MSGAASLDLRLPIGGLFLALGVIITGYGLATTGNPTMYARSGGMNINLWWGLVLLLTGVVFLLLARRGAARDRAALAAARAGAGR